MRMRKVGNTDLMVSEVCLGTGSFGGRGMYKMSGDIQQQEANSIVACLVQAADAISAARPGARRENIETYIKRLQKLEEIATSFDGVEKSFAIQAGREVRIMVKPDRIGDGDMDFIAREIVKKIESDMEYPGQIKVNIIRETRTVAFAK